LGRVPDVTDPAVGLAAAIRARAREQADPAYVAGTVEARRPGKPVLGVRIPLLRCAVHESARAAFPPGTVADLGVTRRAADALWRGEAHEFELAACMLMRRAGVPPTAGLLQGWAPLLDNWLSVDELGGVVGLALQAGHLQIQDVLFLAAGQSPWQRRLFLVGLITPIRSGMDPAAVPALPEVLRDAAPPVRKAAAWLISNVIKARPGAVAQFRVVLPGRDPRPLVRLLDLAALPGA
jgi:hypothetical protein